jgi:hypothetical protein
MKHARSLVLAGVMCVAVTAVPAHDIAPPLRGARLRLTLATGDRPLVGAFLALDASTLTLQVPGRTDAMAVGRDGITRVEVSEGHRSRGTGALYGTLIGAGAGAVIGVVGGAAGNPSGEKAQGAVEGGLILAVLGAPLGALV